MTLKINRILLKIGLCALLLLSAAGTLTAKTIYLQAGIWNTGGAWYQIYYWDGSTGWATMENVTCDIFKATIPDNAKKLKFLRRAPNTPGNNWNNIWNETNDLTPGSNNKFDVTTWNTGQYGERGEYSGGSWYSHSVVPKNTYIYFNNSKTQWDDVYMSIVCGCTNKDAQVWEYNNGEDCVWVKMERYCGDIYRTKLDRDAFFGLFSFFANSQQNYDHPYATSALLHFGLNTTTPVANPYERTFDDGRQTYVWSGNTQALPSGMSSATPLSQLPLSTTVTNPVHRGTSVTLTVDDLSQEWIWYKSSDGRGWSSTIDGVSGTKHESITNAPQQSTYYMVRDADNICKAMYRIEIDIECDGDKKILLDLNFDTDASNQYFTTYKQRRSVIASRGESVNTSIYAYSPEDKEILDGFYAILANPYWGGFGMQQTSSSCHATSCLSNTRTPSSTNHAWYSDIKDHTHGGADDGKIGGMLMANCKDKEEVIFSYKTPKLCGHNLFMTFSAWFANATTYVKTPGLTDEILPINAQIRILNEAKTEEVAHIDVNNVKPNANWSLAWKEGRSSFFSGENDYLTIQIVNYGESGTGNDILIDDIKFTACVPRVDARPTTDVDCGDETTLEVDPEGIAEIFDGTPYYLWQRWNYSTSQWVSIDDATMPGGSGFGNVTYKFATEEHPENEKPKFRVVMSNSRSVARDVGAGNPPDCVNFAITEDILVDCACVPQSISKTSGSATQTVCEGNSISNVVYASSGTANKNAAAIGLPDGLTATKSGKNLTISGTLPIIDKDSTYTIKVFAEGTAGVSCPSDTLELVINSKRKPSLTLRAGDFKDQFICRKTNNAEIDSENDYIVDDIQFTWGGSATDVSFNQSPTPTASQAGLDANKVVANKTITLSGSPARSTTYTVSTTGQNSACAAAVMSGTITVGDIPAEPPLRYRQIQ